MAKAENFRARLLMEHGRTAEAALGYLRAFLRVDGNQGIFNCLSDATKRWGKEIRSQIGEGFPRISIRNRRYWHRHLTGDVNDELNYLCVMETILKDPVRKAMWWDPIRQDPKHPPPSAPECIQATFPADPAGKIEWEVCRAGEQLLTTLTVIDTKMFNTPS